MKHSALRVSAVALLLATALAACSGRGESSAPRNETISECDQYVATVDRCLGQLGAAARIPAARHAAVTHDAIAAATKDARDVGARDALRARCTAGMASLAGSCR